MKVLGSILITPARQRQIAEGAVWDIPRVSMRAKILAGARIGDLIWLREPYVEIKSRRHTPKQFHEFIRGASPSGLKIPPAVRPYLQEAKMHLHPARAMTRAISMTTLEIMGLLPDAVRVAVHDAQVDDFRKQARAACG